MKLKHYLQIKRITRGEFAESVGTTHGYVDQLISGHRRPSPEMALAIEEATHGAVTKEELRPDIWPHRFCTKCGHLVNDLTQKQQLHENVF